MSNQHHQHDPGEWQAAWSDRYPSDSSPARPSSEAAGRRGEAAGRRSPRITTVLAATALLAIAISGLAVAANGDPLRLGKRNEGTQETAIVVNAGGNAQSTRQSNGTKGGRAAGYGCENDAPNEINACANYVNRGQGPAAAFRTRGTTPFVIRDTNTGRVEFLNSDLLDDKNARDVVMWAAVRSNGTLARSFGTNAQAPSANIQGPGRYEVRFERDVTGCTSVATLSDPDQGDNPPSGEIGTAPRAGVPDGVFVRTYNSNGNPNNMPFSVAVVC